MLLTLNTRSQGREDWSASWRGLWSRQNPLCSSSFAGLLVYDPSLAHGGHQRKCCSTQLRSTFCADSCGPAVATRGATTDGTIGWTMSNEKDPAFHWTFRLRIAIATWAGWLWGWGSAVRQHGGCNNGTHRGGLDGAVSTRCAGSWRGATSRTGRLYCYLR